jgi:methionyl-tRNA formyltransferase
MRIVFMGAPDFAAPSLKAIVEAGHAVVAVYTRAPKPAGRRGLNLAKTPIHLLAEEFGIPIATPTSLRGLSAQEMFVDHAADAAVVVAYGLILPRAILDATRLGCFNLHASLLPRWRGAAPIQRAIMAGDRETGVSVMRMEEGLDTGPVGQEVRMGISVGQTTGDVTPTLAQIGARLMISALDQLDEGGDADVVRDRIHGLSPAPGAFSLIDLARGSERIKFLRVEALDGSGPPGVVLDDSLAIACGRGAIRVIEAQRSGKQAMGREAFQRGAHIQRGAQFISSDTP